MSCNQILERQEVEIRSELEVEIRSEIRDDRRFEIGSVKEKIIRE